MTNYEYEIGTEVVAKSKDIDVTCVGKIHDILEDDGILEDDDDQSVSLEEIADVPAEEE